MSALPPLHATDGTHGAPAAHGPAPGGDGAEAAARTARFADARVERLVRLYEALAPADLDRLHLVYTEDARFKDPFNAVQGLPAIRAVFAHMFTALQGPRFEVLEAVTQGDACFLTWDFRFRVPRMGPAEQCIHGASHVKFAPDGRVALHRDYWDAAEELYEKIPLLGGLMRWLKRRAGG